MAFIYNYSILSSLEKNKTGLLATIVNSLVRLLSRFLLIYLLSTSSAEQLIYKYKRTPLLSGIEKSALLLNDH
jgi:NhaP-type Na+/H+ or K+/H+ antiporter